jgi:hypothetical protein
VSCGGGGGASGVASSDLGGFFLESLILSNVMDFVLGLCRISCCYAFWQLCMAAGAELHDTFSFSCSLRPWAPPSLADVDDLAKVLSSGRRRQRTLLGVLCVKIAGSDEIRSRVSFFVWPFGFRGSAAKLYCILPSWTCLLRFMMMSETENIVEQSRALTSTHTYQLWSAGRRASMTALCKRSLYKPPDLGSIRLVSRESLRQRRLEIGANRYAKTIRNWSRRRTTSGSRN